MQENEQNGAASADPHRHNGRVDRLQRRLLEAFDRLWDDLVDPEDALYDESGTRWSLLGDGLGHGAAAPFRTESQLREIRNHCRALAVGNEFAINGHENQFTRTTFRIRRSLRTFRSGSGPPRTVVALPGTGLSGTGARHWGTVGGVQGGREPGFGRGRRWRICPVDARTRLGAHCA